MNKVLRVFFDVNMGGAHKSLARVASKFKVDIHSLKPGEHVLFINRAKDKAKLYSSGQVLSYINNGKLTRESLDQFCRVYGARDLQFDALMKKVLEKHLGMNTTKTSAQKYVFDAATLSA